MGIPHITQELSSFAKLSTAPPTASGVIAVTAGATIDLTTIAALISTGCQVTTLTRRPAGSAAAIASHAFTTDAAVYGEFDASVVVLGQTQNLRIVSFPASFLTARTNPNASGSSVPAVTLTLGNLAAWASIATLAQVGTAIEVAAPTIGALWAVPGVGAALSTQP